MIKNKIKSYYFLLSVSLIEKTESSKKFIDISNKKKDLLESSKESNDTSNKYEGLIEESESSTESNNVTNKYGGLFIEDKWARVKLLFEKDDMGNNHPDLEYTYEMFVFGLVFGGFIGGIVESFNRTIKYIQENDATLFFKKKEADKNLARISLLGFYKGAVRIGPLIGIFLGSFTLLSSLMQAYRNKNGIIEYSFGGFTVGALLRFKYGWRGMLSGGIVGGTLGTFYGLFNYAKLKILNMSESEFRYAQLSLSKYRKEWREKLAENEKNQ